MALQRWKQRLLEGFNRLLLLVESIQIGDGPLNILHVGDRETVGIELFRGLSHFSFADRLRPDGFSHFHRGLLGIRWHLAEYFTDFSGRAAERGKR